MDPRGGTLSAAYPDLNLVVPETDSIFGRIVTGWDIEQWVLSTFQRWCSTYMSEVERQHGLEELSLQRPRSWVPATAFDSWPEDQIPRVILVCTGTTEQPQRGGDGVYRARFAVGVAVICSGRQQHEAHRNAMFTVAALRALLEHRPSLDGRANGTKWMTEDYDPLPWVDQRTLAAGLAAFWVEADDVTTAFAGPVDGEPSDEEWPPWPRVEDVIVEVENTTVDQPLPQVQLAGRLIELTRSTYQQKGGST